ncbi:GNAT family N-acetyltransferase [Demetria terragena]|uniref:GNAT family N-acetyltransferase n=1 Tax=Demetria terragena TaxID=63959 RepID=UPI00036E10CF|nr:GNAT family N-acetyltransferase [Demetria terragena]
MDSPPGGTVPTLVDGEVRLRAPLEIDIPRIVEQCRDPRTLAMTSGVPVPYGEDDARTFLANGLDWASGQGCLWSIDVDGDFAGTVNCSRQDTADGPVGEIGYGLHPDLRGRGIATRAVRLVVDHAFDTWGVRSLRWRANARNFASRRAAWANGFVVDGVLPDGHPNSDGTLDDCLFGHLHRGAPREPAHAWWEPAVLEGNGIRLRPWRADDAIPEGPDEASTAFSEGMQPSPGGYATWWSWRQNRMAHGEGVFWCVVDSSTDEPLGHVQIIRLNVDFIHGSGLVGYWAYPAVRGRGVLGRALELLIPHAFAPRTDTAGLSGLGLHRLQAGTDLDNRSSQRVLRRAGFRQVAEEQEVLARPDGTHAGALTFELLATDDRDAQRVHPAPAKDVLTDRLRLRPWHPSDRPEVMPDAPALAYMSANVMPTPDNWQTWLARRGRLRDAGVHDFCIANRDSDQPLGSIAIFGIDRKVGDGGVGYWLYPAARGHGILDEALTAIVAHAFTLEADGGAGLVRLHAGAVLDNYASRGALLRAGFRLIGEDHQAFVSADGVCRDGVSYELLRQTWASQASALAIPAIEGERVRLRPWRMSDAPRVVEACADATTRHWLPQLPRDYDENVARAYIHSTREDAAAGRSVTWCVADVTTDLAVGSLEAAELRGPRPDTAAIGYWAHPEARGRGVITEAVSLAVRHAFAPSSEGGLGRQRVVLIAADGNHGSMTVAERSGFRHTGTDHDAEVLGDGSRVSMHRFELLRTDRP